MRTIAPVRRVARQQVLLALKRAVIEGANWRYDELVKAALAAGVSVDEIDVVAYEALQALLAGAELPLTARQLAHDWPLDVTED